MKKLSLLRILVFVRGLIVLPIFLFGGGSKLGKTLIKMRKMEAFRRNDSE